MTQEKLGYMDFERKGKNPFKGGPTNTTYYSFCVWYTLRPYYFERKKDKKSFNQTYFIGGFRISHPNGDFCSIKIVFRLKKVRRRYWILLKDNFDLKFSSGGIYIYIQSYQGYY